MVGGDDGLRGGLRTRISKWGGCTKRRKRKEESTSSGGDEGQRDMCQQSSGEWRWESIRDVHYPVVDEIR